MNPKNLRVTLSYDGTDFSGWQIQATGRTVQGCVEQALAELHGKHIRVHAAGRTDSGVHARKQVISFPIETTIPIQSFTRALNSRLPRDVRAIHCDVVPDDFHARYSARRREYKYYIEPAEFSDPFTRRFAFTIKDCPATSTLDSCAAILVGTHDFTTFSAVGDQSESKVRAVHSASFYNEGRFVVFRIVGNAFLWKMVRSLVGTILECCRTADPIREFTDRLIDKERERAGTTAPAKGLFLAKVYYGD
jgi:tRNA pseudouridine38-40 synthase